MWTLYDLYLLDFSQIRWLILVSRSLFPHLVSKSEKMRLDGKVRGAY